MNNAESSFAVLGTPALVEPPELRQVTIGFVALSDCASVVMAKHLGLFERYGLDVTLARQPSWAALRDRLVVGQIDAAHVLYGLMVGLHLGIGGPQNNAAILMGLNRNGQGIVLSDRLRDEGVTDGPSLKSVIERKERTYTFAQTFPTGTHAMWLNYWLAAQGIDPAQDVRVITIAPPLMPAAMKEGRIDGFCVGEPWCGLYAGDAYEGFRVITTGAIWPDHPEKVLGATAQFAELHPNTCRAMIAAILEASRYVEDATHHAEVAAVIAAPEYVDAPVAAVLASLRPFLPPVPAPVPAHTDQMRFFDSGDVNFPYLSDALWFLTQHRRWGLLASDIDYRAVVKTINRVDLYSSVARALSISVPATSERSSVFFDGSVWDSSHLDAYLHRFADRLTSR